MTNTAERFLYISHKGVLEPVPVQMFVKPPVDSGPLTGITRPGGADETNFPVTTKADPAAPMKQIRVDSVMNDYRADRLKTHFPQTLIGPGRLEYGCLGIVGIYAETQLVFFRY